jgi:predicted nuclease of restriction endonuclease-like RecB superfamily
MSYIEGDADTGFTITIDGPNSLFKASTRYGLSLAKMIPALLLISKWSLKAQLHNKDFYTGQLKTAYFSLTNSCDLVTHYPNQKTYDSLLEESFAQRWSKEKTEWVLEREVNLVPLPGSVMIPDFRLVHPEKGEFLLEIIGYWRPEYLKKKFYQLQKANVSNIIIAISERLNLEKAGVNFNTLNIKTVWFKDKLSPKQILIALEEK